MNHKFPELTFDCRAAIWRIAAVVLWGISALVLMGGCASLNVAPENSGQPNRLSQVMGKIKRAVRPADDKDQELIPSEYPVDAMEQLEDRVVGANLSPVPAEHRFMDEIAFDDRGPFFDQQNIAGLVERRLPNSPTDFASWDGTSRQAIDDVGQDPIGVRRVAYQTPIESLPSDVIDNTLRSMAPDVLQQQIQQPAGQPALESPMAPSGLPQPRSQVYQTSPQRRPAYAAPGMEQFQTRRRSPSVVDPALNMGQREYPNPPFQNGALQMSAARNPPMNTFGLQGAGMGRQGQTASEWAIQLRHDNGVLHDVNEDLRLQIKKINEEYVTQTGALEQTEKALAQSERNGETLREMIAQLRVEKQDLVKEKDAIEIKANQALAEIESTLNALLVQTMRKGAGADSKSDEE